MIKAKKEVNCRYCEKVCKSVAGRKLHVQRKHPGLAVVNADEDDIESGKKQEMPTDIITADCLPQLFQEIASKLIGDQCISCSIREELKTEDFSLMHPQMKIIVNSPSMEHLKKGKIENFYREFFGDVILGKNETIFPNLSNNTSTLVLSKLCDKLISQTKDVKETENINLGETMLLEKETMCLQYISGYVIHKLYNKLKYKQSNTNLDILDLLYSMKGTEEDLHKSKLIDTLNRGGLWAVKPDVEKVFLIAEIKFRSFSAKSPRLQNVDCFVKDLMNDYDLNTNFGNIIYQCETKVENESRKIVLFTMLELFVRVRTFSFARDQVELFKKNKFDARNKTSTSKKGLRKSLKRYCGEATSENTQK